MIEFDYDLEDGISKMLLEVYKNNLQDKYITCIYI